MDMYHLNQIPSETQIGKYLRRIIFGKNIFCPACGSRSVVRYEQRYRCRQCREKFSLLSHTWLADMKLPYQMFWLILWCWTTQIPVKQAKALTKRSEGTIRKWYGLFRMHLPQEQAILQRIVQLDEAYFKKAALLMGKQKGTRKLAYEVIHQNSVQRHHATKFLYENVRPGAKLCTDGAKIYRGIEQWWPVTHRVDLHKKFEFGQTSEIEGMFGNYRTFVRRMYHHHWSENLDEYVREFCFRFSSPEMFENPLFYLEKSLYLVPID